MAQGYFREAGAGPGVVCVHSNASSSGQWRALMDALRPKFLVLAPDSYGAGRSPSWPAGRKVTLRDEVALLEAAFARAGDPFSLVGHSYGGAIALVAAHIHRKRLRAMALYEPTLFSLVEQPGEVDGIRGAVAAASAALAGGDMIGAARYFIDFWMGDGSFDRMPERVQAATAEQVKNIEGWKEALFGEPTPRAAFARLDVPVLLMVGKNSPLSSRAVAQQLARVLPRVEALEFDGMGHMAPVTHPEKVNAAIAAFLERHAL
jgi:pimeloyl-ACP methyl ester carboxylesterase